MEKDLRNGRDWSLPNVDSWIRKNISDEQELEDLIKWDQDVEDIIASVGFRHLC